MSSKLGMRNKSTKIPRDLNQEFNTSQRVLPTAATGTRSRWAEDKLHFYCPDVTGQISIASNSCILQLGPGFFQFLLGSLQCLLAYLSLSAVNTPHTMHMIHRPTREGKDQEKYVHITRMCTANFISLQTCVSMMWRDAWVPVFVVYLLTDSL